MNSQKTKLSPLDVTITIAQDDVDAQAYCSNGKDKCCPALIALSEELIPFWCFVDGKLVTGQRANLQFYCKIDRNPESRLTTNQDGLPIASSKCPLLYIDLGLTDFLNLTGEANE